MDTIENKIFDEAIKELDKKYGKGTFNNSSSFNVDVIGSGSISLDNILTINGFPKGRIIEIYGNESSGKTTIALQAVKECLASGGKAVYIDVENSLDINYLEAIGIDSEKLLLARPESGEQTFNIIDALIKTKMIDLIVVDSVAALVPEVELKGDVVDQNIGAHARLMSKGLRMIQGIISKNNVCVIFINQIREKIGIMFGNPEVTTGGRALKFFSSIRLEVRKSELLKEGNEIIGIKSKVTITKNKLGPPLKQTFIDIFFNKGYDFKNEVINFAINYEIIKRNGSWFYFNEQKLCQGRNQLTKFFDDNEPIYQDIKNKILEIKK